MIWLLVLLGGITSQDLKKCKGLNKEETLNCISQLIP